MNNLKLTGEDIEGMVIEFICRNFMVSNPDSICRSKSLIDQGIIDSFGLIEIAAFMDSKFSVTVEDMDMHSGNFGSVISMTDFIAKKLGSS